MSYDRALTVFSPDGHLFQVEYAMEAVGIRGRDTVVLAVEKKTIPKLQDPRTLKKIVQIDNHLWVGFAGLTADARILLGKARVEAQSHRLTIEDAPSVEYMARHIAGVQQEYTQKGGVRPFGLCCLVIGFDGQKPRLFLTEPSGLHSEWIACAVGRGSKSVREYLETKVKDVAVADAMESDSVIRTAIEALLEVVQTGPQSMDVAVLSVSNPQDIRMLDTAQIASFVGLIDQERAEEAERRRTATGVRI